MSIKSRSYFSIPYLCGAAQFAADAATLETSTPTTDVTALRHRACVIAAITSSVAALEAMINETYADSDEPDIGALAALSSEVRSKVAAAWRIPRTTQFAILDKFDLLHLLVAGTSLDRSTHHWGNASWLVRLRNDFVHYEPSWQEHAAPVEFARKVELGLSHMFEHNRLAGAANPFYPDRLLGCGCAAWALTTALQFADTFWKSVGLAAPYEAHRYLFKVS
jgi:hypothetical protein